MNIARCDERDTVILYFNSDKFGTVGTRITGRSICVMVGDPINGKKLFMKMCATCHTTEKNAKHKAGPNLHSVVGKTCGTERGFNFSKGMKEKNVVWNEKTLNDYMEFPREFIPGTTKMFSVKKAEDRRDLIAYLATLK